MPPRRFPEPLHRVPPEPVGSGISFRSLPVASLKQIQKVCQHYEKKAQGSYDHHSKAGRYVYDMSQEIQAIVSGMLEDERNQPRRVRHLEKLISEWEVVFGHPYDWHGRYNIGPGEILTPKLLDIKFKQLQTDVKRREEDLLETKKTLEIEREASRRALDETLFRERIKMEHRISEIQAASTSPSSPEPTTTAYMSEDGYWRAMFSQADRDRSAAEARLKLMERKCSNEEQNARIAELEGINERLREKVEYLLSEVVSK